MSALSYQDEINSGTGHHILCNCFPCAIGMDTLPDETPCECNVCRFGSKNAPIGLELKYNSDDIIISALRINDKIIAITRDDLGDFWVSSRHVDDFTCEEVYAINILEAIAEAKKFADEAGGIKSTPLLPSKNIQPTVCYDCAEVDSSDDPPYIVIANTYIDESLSITTSYNGVNYLIKIIYNSSCEYVLADSLQEANECIDNIINKHLLERAMI